MGSSLLQQSWNSAPSAWDGRELPPYPRRYPGPWLGPLSFVARHTPVVPPFMVGTVGTSIANAAMERRSTCPSSDGTTCDQDGSCFEDRRGCCSPWTTLWEGPTTRELALSRVNSATRSELTVPRSSLSLIRLAFRRRLSGHCYSTHPVFSRASHLAAGRASDTLVNRGSDLAGSQARQ